MQQWLLVYIYGTGSHCWVLCIVFQIVGLGLHDCIHILSSAHLLGLVILGTYFKDH